MPRKSTPSNMRRNCLDRAREYIVARGYCERCGTAYGPFECAHIIRRSQSVWVMTDERNLWCLCRACHYLVDTTHSELDALIEKTIGREVFRELEIKSKRGYRGPNGEAGEKFDWEKELERWKAMR